LFLGNFERAASVTFGTGPHAAFSMNSKNVSNLLIVVCVIALVWYLWPHPAKPAPAPRAVPARPAFQNDYSQNNPAPYQAAVPDAPDPNQAAIAAAAAAILEQQAQRAILNNLRQIGTGAATYFTAVGVSSVALSDIVGTNPSQFVQNLSPVANETYPAVIYQGQALTASDPTNGRTVTYSF
jgi:hypothetical protein